MGRQRSRMDVARDNIDRPPDKEALRYSESRLNAILRASPAGIGLVRDRIIMEVSDQLCALVGYRGEELVGQPARLLYPNDEEYERVERSNCEAIRSCGAGSIETGWRRKDGTVIGVLLNFSPLDLDDFEAGVVFMALDITERRTADETLRQRVAMPIVRGSSLVGFAGFDNLCEEIVWAEEDDVALPRASADFLSSALMHERTGRALCENEERFRVLFQEAPDPIFLLDREGNFVDGNRAAETAVGYEKSELIGENFLAAGLLVPVDFEKASESFAQNLAGLPTGPDNYQLSRKDGTQIPLEIRTYPLTVGSQDLILGIARDITQRKKAEQLLRESEKRFRDLAELLPQTIFEADLNGRLTFVNRKAMEVFGYDEDDAYRRFTNLDMLAPHEHDRARRNMTKVLRGEDSRGNEYVARNKAGRLFPVEIHSAPILRNGKPMGWRGIVIDLSEREKAQAALRESEARYRSIIESSPMGMLVYELQPDGSLILAAANPAANAILGIDNGQLVGLAIEEAFPPLAETEIPDRYRAAARDGESWSAEQVAYKDDHISGVFEVHAFQTSPNTMTATFLDITERKQADEALRESERFLQSVFEAIQDGLCVLDRDLTVVRTNQWMQRMYADHAPLEGKKCYEVFQRHDAPCAGCPTLTAMSTGKPQFAEVPYLKEGTPTGWIELSAFPLRNERGDVTGVIEYVKDVTERVHAVKALQQSEARARAILDATQETVMLLDPDGTVLQCNETGAARLGMTNEEIIGTCLYDAFPPEVAKRRRKLLPRAARSGEPVYFEDEREGMSFEVSAYPVKDNEDNARSVAVFARDVTERKRNEEALRENEERLRTVVQTMPVMVDAFDESHNIIVWNQECERVTGYTAEEIVGNPRALEMLYPDPAYREEIIARLRKPEADFRNQEFCLTAKSGEIRTVAWSNLSDSNAIPGWRTWAAGIDVTERKRAEKIQAEAEKLAATGRMAAQVAHEINNPLAGIKNSFRLIRDAVPENHPDWDMVERIEKEIDRIAHVVRQMYRLHSPKAQTLTNCLVGEAIQDVVLMLEPLRREHEVELQLPPAFSDYVVKAPEGGLQQILFNLIANAIEATPSGGVVSFGVALTDTFIKISICDEGPGISCQLRERIFEPFFTSKTGLSSKEGLGLGLSIVKGVVESVGGKVVLESKPGCGSCFHVYLPPR